MTESGASIGLRGRARLWPLCLAAMLGMLSNRLEAATFAVNSTIDAVDAAPGNGVCATAGGLCTLRAAIQEANALGGADTVNLPGGTYTVGIPGSENAAAAGDLDIRNSSLTLNGAGSGVTIVDGGGLDRVFHLFSGIAVSLTGITVRGGSVLGSHGAGIRSVATLTLTDVIVTGNSTDRNGGGIHSQGGGASLTLTDSTVSGNTARDGAGIWNRDGLVNLTDVTLGGNAATRDGGGLRNHNGNVTLTRVTLDGNTANTGGGISNRRNGAVLTLTNVTLSENVVVDRGGGLFNRDANTATLTNVTFEANSAGNGGGAIRRSGGTVQLRNTIVANSPSGGNCSGAITSLGNNLDSANTCGFTAPGDLVNTAPNLGPLQDNGGPTYTHALLTNSPAIDAGTNTGCPATDQRLVTRPADGDCDLVAICDMGAYEFISTPGLLVIKSVSTLEDPINGTTNPKAIPAATGLYTIDVRNQGAGPTDLDSMAITDPIPVNTSLRVIDFAGGNPGPVSFVDGAPASGLTYTFISLGSAADDVEFSDDGGATYTYTPVDSGDGTDPAVDRIRINPKGCLDASATGDPRFQVRFKFRVQ